MSETVRDDEFPASTTQRANGRRPCAGCQQTLDQLGEMGDVLAAHEVRVFMWAGAGMGVALVALVIAGYALFTVRAAA